MPDAGVDPEVALGNLGNRAGALLAELAIKDALIAQLQARLAEAEKGGDGDRAE